MRGPVPVPDPTLLAFGEVVRELREARGMTQWALAETAGLHRNTPGLIERGERVPSLITIEAIAKAFDIDASELLLQTERRRKQSS